MAGYKKEIIESIRENRFGKENINKQNCLMKIIEYISNRDIIVEFQDEYKAKVHTSYQCFLSGSIRNPYYPSVYEHGIIGNKYSSRENNKKCKEYVAWQHMIQRCYDKKYRNKNPSYQNVTCCNEWLLYENFYEWLHSQGNFDKWLSGNGWDIDKDILVKGNKVYSSETCCLVPQNINKLFIKNDVIRGILPLGVSRDRGKFRALCNNPFTKEYEYLGEYETPEDAFYLGYKPYKENIIKKVAQIEYDKGNITEICYNAMMNYEVEITD